MSKIKEEKHDEDFKRKIAKEALEVRNNSAVGKKYNISESTVRCWIKKYYSTSMIDLVNVNNTTKKNEISKEVVKDLKEANKKIDYYTKIIGEKELEIQVLRDLLKKLNVRLPTNLK